LQWSAHIVQLCQPVLDDDDAGRRRMRIGGAFLEHQEAAVQADGFNST
jgi:hypothetical protein